MAASSGARLVFGNSARRGLGDFTKLLPRVLRRFYISADLAEWLDKRNMGHVRADALPCARWTVGKAPPRSLPINH